MTLLSLYKFIDLFLIGILLILYVFVPEGASYLLIWFCLSIFYYCFYHALKKPVAVIPTIPSYFKPDFLFMVFYYIIFFLPYQTFVLGLNDLATNNYISNPFVEYTNISLVTSTIGLVAFSLGYKKQFQIPSASGKAAAQLSYYRYLPQVATVLFIGVFILYLSTGASAMFSGAYATSDVGTTAENGIFFLLNHFAMLIIALVIIFYRSGSYPWALKISSVLVILWLLGLLVIGDRNTFFLLAIVAGAGISIFIKKITIPQITGLIVSALFLYSVIELSRKSDVRGVGAIIEASLEGGKGESLMDGSFSITTITSRAAFAVVPKKHDYFMGKFKLIGVAGIVPFSRSLIVAPNDPYTTSSKVLKDEMIGRYAIWGVGSNIVTDIYMDFGVLGVVILMYFLGFFACYVKSKVQSDNTSIMWGTLYLYTLALYAELPRYSFDFPIRYMVWTVLLFIAYSWLVKKNKSNYE